MKRFLVLIAVSISLVMTSCDRFEHTFEVKNSQDLEEFKTNFKDNVANVSNGSLEQLRAMFCDDYQNDEYNKDGIIDFITFNPVDCLISFEADSINFVSGVEFSYILRKKTIDTQQIVMDTLLTDYIINENGNIKFYGNQYGKQKVLAELFTATWCPNCPYSEDALHELQLKYSSKLIYVEYHAYDELMPTPVLDAYDFYNATAYPSVFFQGEDSIEDGHPGISEEMNTIIEPYYQTSGNVSILIKKYSENGNNLNAEIKYNSSLNTDNLYLKYVVMDKLNSDYHNMSGEDLHNVALSGGKIALSENSETINLDLGNKSNIPDDASLVVWIQKMGSSYDSNSKIYNVMEKMILRR
jgi:thiol-disulfide isomerase/thioredoxin